LHSIYRKTAHSLSKVVLYKPKSKIAKIKMFINYKREIYALGA